MKSAITERDRETVSKIIFFHSQKVMDHRALGNAGQEKIHAGYVETLRKAQAVLRGDAITCEGCVREKSERMGSQCLNCARNVEVPDNFKRRAKLQFVELVELFQLVKLSR